MDSNDKRGTHMKRRGEENRRKIEKYMSEYPDAKKIEISRDLGLSRVTVDAHINAMENEKK